MSDCPDCGHCRWAGCEFDADYVVKGVTIKRHGTLLYVGDVDLCSGHYRWTSKTGHLNLDWSVVDKALEPLV